MRGGSKVVWIFSESWSVLVASLVPMCDNLDDCDADVATAPLVLLRFLAFILSRTMKVIALLPFSMCCNLDQWETSILCFDQSETSDAWSFSANFSRNITFICSAALTVKTCDNNEYYVKYNFVKNNSVQGAKNEGFSRSASLRWSFIAYGASCWCHRKSRCQCWQIVNNALFTLYLSYRAMLEIIPSFISLFFCFCIKQALFPTWQFWVRLKYISKARF